MQEFDVRLKKELPDLTFDMYISSGGPGSPLENEENGWEPLYFEWLGSVEKHNTNNATAPKKHVLFICHSFQLACRYFKVGNVAKRKSTSFGVFPVHKVETAADEPVFSDLPDPFYAVDSRDYQVIEPDHDAIEQLGAKILAIEKERPHVPLERAVMALRFNDYMLGTQFHPEADADGMAMHLMQQEKMQEVIRDHGFDKWKSMLSNLGDPEKIKSTYSQVIPNFLKYAIDDLRQKR